MSKLPRSRERILWLIKNSESFLAAENVSTRREGKSEISSSQEQQVKRRRLGTRTPHRPAPVPQIPQPTIDVPSVEPEKSTGAKITYEIVWRRGYPGIKHKRFTGDGKLVVSGCIATLHDGDGRVLGEVSPFKPVDFLDGSILLVGAHECQLSE